MPRRGRNEEENIELHEDAYGVLFSMGTGGYRNGFAASISRAQKVRGTGPLHNNPCTGALFLVHPVLLVTRNSSLVTLAVVFDRTEEWA